MSSPDLEEIVHDLVSSQAMPETTKISELLSLMQKARSERQAAKGDCADPTKDCPDLLSPCCSAPLTTVFGTLPLQVECSKCEARHLLRDVILAAPKL